ncbi:MAG: segregation and condensation protein B [Pirellulaceae bacterium]|jgi:segregation and condensation protein B
MADRNDDAEMPADDVPNDILPSDDVPSDDVPSDDVPSDDSDLGDESAELVDESFEEEIGDEGLSLEALSDAYAALLDQGNDPYEEVEEPADAQQTAPVVVDIPDLDATDDDAQCEISPRSILEAMLFVGHPGNEPITSAQVAALMRGVRVREVQEMCNELNEIYRAEGSPFEIKSVDAGFSMALRPEFASLSNKFYGRIKDAKLSQQAIEVLSIVAYNQPITKNGVEKMRGKPSGGLLRQLVRRELLRIDRPDSSPKNAQYLTSDRFLRIFHLDAIEDLPQSHELERNL